MRMSVVVASRNDDHGTHLVQRTQAFVNGLYGQMKRYGIETELILVEWNPPRELPKLHTLLSWPSPSAIWQASAIIVPPAIHNELAQDTGLDFLQMWAKNVGVCRARHPWILCTNPDVVFSDELCESLSQVCGSRRCVFGTHRLDLDVGIDLIPDDMGLKELVSFCAEHVKQRNAITTNGVLTDGCGDFMLASDTLWDRTRGYLEFPIWSIHLDSLTLMQMIYAFGWHQELLPGGIYHIAHERSWMADQNWAKKLPQFTFQRIGKILNDMRSTKKQEYYNSKAWGLADRFLEVKKLG